MRAAFVYPNSRRAAARGSRRRDRAGLAAARRAPISHEHGIDVRYYDPLLTRRPLPAAVRSVLAWNMRELTLPFELRGVDVVFTPLGAAGLPLAGGLRRLPVVVINFGLNLIWRRASPARRRWLRRSLGARGADRLHGRVRRPDELLELTGFPPDARGDVC